MTVLPVSETPRQRPADCWLSCQHLLAVPVLILLILILSGCQSQLESTVDKPADDPPDDPLKVIVVDDPKLAQAITQQWKARAATKIKVSQITSAELLKSQSLETDLIIYPSAQLGPLVERQLVLPLQKYLAQSNTKHNQGLLPTQRRAEVYWGADLYAASFGSPQLVLYYRRDIFAGLKLQPPETWADYQQLLATLNDRENVAPYLADEQSSWQATAEPLGAGWAAQTLLARAAGYVRHPNQYSALFDYLSLEPLISGPPFVRALEELQQATSGIAADRFVATPDDTRQLFYSGGTAMALSWPSLVASTQTESPAGDAVSTGWALLPGSREIYNASDATWENLPQQESAHVPLLAISGRLGSVSRNSSHPQWATESLLHLTSAKWSASISRHSPHTTLFRNNHLSDPLRWLDSGTSAAAAGQFAETFRQASTPSRILFCLRIPGRARYLAALDQAVFQTLRKESSATDALTEVSEQWEVITEELGREQQARAYRQSLGLEP